MVSAYAIFNLQADVVSRWQQKLYRKEEVAEHISNALEQHTMTSIPLIPRPAAVQYKRRIFAPHAQRVKRNISMLYNGLCHLKKSIAIRLHQYHSTIRRSANTIMVLLWVVQDTTISTLSTHLLQFQILWSIITTSNQFQFIMCYDRLLLTIKVPYVLTIAITSTLTQL